MIEYIVVIAFGLLILVSGDPSPIEKLAQSIKDYYRGYAYGISLSDYPDGLELDDLRNACIAAGRSSTECDQAIDAVGVMARITRLIGRRMPPINPRPPTITIGDLTGF